MSYTLKLLLKTLEITMKKLNVVVAFVALLALGGSAQLFAGGCGAGCSHGGAKKADASTEKTSEKATAKATEEQKSEKKEEQKST